MKIYLATILLNLFIMGNLELTAKTTGPIFKMGYHFNYFLADPELNMDQKSIVSLEFGSKIPTSRGCFYDPYGTKGCSNYVFFNLDSGGDNKRQMKTFNCGFITSIPMDRNLELELGIGSQFMNLTVLQNTYNGAGFILKSMLTYNFNKINYLSIHLSDSTPSFELKPNTDYELEKISMGMSYSFIF